MPSESSQTAYVWDEFYRRLDALPGSIQARFLIPIFAGCG